MPRPIQTVRSAGCHFWAVECAPEEKWTKVWYSSVLLHLDRGRARVSQFTTCPATYACLVFSADPIVTYVQSRTVPLNKVVPSPLKPCMTASPRSWQSSFMRIWYASPAYTGLVARYSISLGYTTAMLALALA